jgi:hypothetical protein
MAATGAAIAVSGLLMLWGAEVERGILAATRVLLLGLIMLLWVLLVVGMAFWFVRDVWRSLRDGLASELSGGSDEVNHNWSRPTR